MSHTRLRTRLALTAARVGFLLIAADSRAAQGVGLAWNHCQGEVGAVQNAVFACDTNAGEHVIYGTFMLDAEMSAAFGMDIRLTLVASGGSLPAWWQLRNTGTCRRTSMISRLDPDPAATTCVDWTGGFSQFGASSLYCTSSVACGAGLPANTAEILIGVATPENATVDLVANQSYFTFDLHIDHAKTVGAGACGGCSTPVCIDFSQARLETFGGSDIRLITTPTIPGGDVITWQGGGTGAPSCLAVTPTRMSTWGSVKALYR
jgi:hypothetical protein